MSEHAEVKQHAKITPEGSDLWTAIWVRSGSNLAAAKQILGIIYLTSLEE